MDPQSLPPVGSTIPAATAATDLPPVGTSVSAAPPTTPTFGGRLKELAGGLLQMGLDTFNPVGAGVRTGVDLGRTATFEPGHLPEKLAELGGIPASNLEEDYRKGAIGAGVVDAAQTALVLGGFGKGLHEAIARPTIPLEAPEAIHPAETPSQAPVATPAVAPAEALPPVGTSVAAEVPREPVVKSAHVDLPAVGTTVPSTEALEASAVAKGAPVPPAGPIAAADLAPEDTFLQRFPEEQRPAMQAVLEANGGFEAQRRGVQSNERTAALAKEIQAQPVAAGTALNAEQLQALANATLTAFDRVSELSKKVASGNATDLDRLQLKQANSEAATLLQSARGATAEAGRTLQSTTIVPEILKANPDAARLHQILQTPEGKGIDDFAQQWMDAPNDDARLKLLQSQQPKMSKFDMLISAFYSSLLSAPRTIARAFTGTASNAAFRKASLFPAAAVDAVQSAITGEPRTIRPLTELAAQARTVPEAATAAAKTAADVLKSGHINSSELLQNIANGTGRVPRPELPGGGANPINWPTRAFQAKFEGMQKFYGMPELNGRLASEAARQADAADVTGDVRQAFLDQKTSELAADPPPDIVKAASDEARSILFREPSGPFLKAIENFGERGGALGKITKTVVVPFAQIGGKIIKQGIENSPLAPLSGQFQAAMKAGGRVRAEALGRVATGTSLMGTAAGLAAAGYITGAGPSDPTQRANWLQTHQPYSLKIGDHYYGFDQLAQPVALGLRTVADAVENYADTGKIDPVQVLTSLGPNIVNNSFLSGLSSAIDAVANKDRSGMKFAQGLAQDMVPFSSGLRSLTQTLDPTVRAPETVPQAIEAIIPGLSKNVPAKLDEFGKPIVRTANALQRGLSPSLVSQVSKDPVVLALQKHGITDIGVPVTKLPKSGQLPALTLTQDERMQLGQATRQAVELVVNNPGFASLDDEAAKTLVHRAIQAAHDNAIKRIRWEHYTHGS